MRYLQALFIFGGKLQFPLTYGWLLSLAGTEINPPFHHIQLYWGVKCFSAATDKKLDYAFCSAVSRVIIALIYCQILINNRIYYNCKDIMIKIKISLKTDRITGQVQYTNWKGVGKKPQVTLDHVTFCFSVQGSEKQFAGRIFQSIRCHVGSFSTHPFNLRKQFHQSVTQATC